MLRQLLVLILLFVPVVMWAQDKNFYIYLCIGQSNMVGQGEISEQDKQVSERFLNMSAAQCGDRKIGEWYKAVPPLCRCDTKLSPADYFGRTMLDSLPKNHRVGIVHVAIDGCALPLFDKDKYQDVVKTMTEDWQKYELSFYNNNPYQRLIHCAKLAQKDGVIKGILVHQGETDAYSDQWIKNLQKIYTDILTDLNLTPENVPLLVGQTANADMNGVCAHANPTISKVHNFIPTAFAISSSKVSVSNDNVHFSADGYRELGKRYALKMLEIMRKGILNTDNVLDNLSTSNESFSVVVDNVKLKAVSSLEVVKYEITSFSGKEILSKSLPKPSKKIKLPIKNVEDRPLIVSFYTFDGKHVSKLITK